VDPDTLPPGIDITHINLNDGTCAGMVNGEKKAMAIQHHPEASPGPHDADVCFEQFIEMMQQEREAKTAAVA
jgi:carbamoyl-phosphate synthase small subunit